MELTVLPLSLANIYDLNAADSFIIGEEMFALRLPYYFKRNELITAIDYIKKQNKKVYLAINKIIHEEAIDQLKTYLQELNTYPIDGFIFGDLAVIEIGKQLGIIDRLIYNPETYITNYGSANFFHNLGIKRLSIAKEITLKDIKLFGENSPIELDVLGHGAISMFHSKRDLVTNYFRFIKDSEPTKYHNNTLYLVEQKRQDEHFPIIEDHNGTHIFNGYDLSTIDYLDQLIDAGIKSIRIDGLFKTPEALVHIVSKYRKAIDDYLYDAQAYHHNKAHYVEQLASHPKIRPFNTGFLFKETVYKGE